jgi:glutaredoxin-related protein
VNGELIGGLDIMVEMQEAGEFEDIKKQVWME